MIEVEPKPEKTPAEILEADAKQKKESFRKRATELLGPLASDQQIQNVADELEKQAALRRSERIPDLYRSF